MSLEDLLTTKQTQSNEPTERKEQRTKDKSILLLLNETSHAMASTLVHYADIYDPEDKKHSEPRWSDVDQRYRYYEGYGQGLCREKADFIESINQDHELWSGETPERKVGCRVFTRDEHIDRMLTESDVGRQVDFLAVTLGWVDYQAHVVQTFMLDGGDRTERVSWNFSKMLSDYCEKACGVEAKEKFFLHGGVGETWSKNKELMKEFSPRFERIFEQLEDEDFKISLSDQSVKDYPRYHFLKLYGKYKEFMKGRGRLNPLATEFVPGAPTVLPKLARCGPPKICGVHSVGPCRLKPLKPTGAPPPRRPSASSRDSCSQLVWEMKQESDTKMYGLEKKLDLLIQMNGPVVKARVV